MLGDNSGDNADVPSSLRRQGSVRKVLPSVPNVDTQAKMIDRCTGTPKGSQSYTPYFLEYSLLAEYNLVHKNIIPGVYVIPAAKTPLQWFGVLFVRQGFYQTGVFRFTLHIPENYPDGDAPKLVFSPPVFHPLINSTNGELDLQRSFSKWRRNVNHIWQVLLYARRVFYKIDITNPVNADAAALFEKDPELFKLKVEESIAHCKQHVYDNPESDDPHALRFTPLENQQYEEMRIKMLQMKETATTTTKSEKGLTWIEPNTLQIFSPDRPGS